MNKATRLLVWALFSVIIGIIIFVLGAQSFIESTKWYEYILPSILCIGGFWIYVEGLSMGKESIKMD